MKRFALSFTGLVLAATAAHAQPAADVTGTVQGDVSGAVEGPLTSGEAIPSADAAGEVAADASVDGSADVASSTEAASAPAPLAATDSTTATISDAEVESFAKVTVELQQIQNDTSIAADQKQTKMAAVVTEAGLDPAKYNEIGAKVSNDAELRARVQTAMSRHAQPSDG